MRNRPCTRTHSLTLTLCALTLAGSGAPVRGATLEEAIASLHSSFPADRRRVDDHTIEDTRLGEQYSRGADNCTGGVRPTHWHEGTEGCDAIGGTGDCPNSPILPDSVPVYQEFHFDEVLPAQIHFETIFDDLTSVNMPGLAYAHVSCNFYRSGKRMCSNTQSFMAREEPLKQATRDIFRDLCPRK